MAIKTKKLLQLHLVFNLMTWVIEIKNIICFLRNPFWLIWTKIWIKTTYKNENVPTNCGIIYDELRIHFKGQKLKM